MTPYSPGIALEAFLFPFAFVFGLLVADVAGRACDTCDGLELLQRTNAVRNVGAEPHWHMGASA